AHGFPEGHSHDSTPPMAQLAEQHDASLSGSDHRQVLAGAAEVSRLASKRAYSLWRRSDICFYLHPHLVWQTAKSDVERGDAFGLVPHEGSLLTRYRLLP